MASTASLHGSPPSIFRPRVRDGMIVVRRPANRNETAIFWAGTYFFPTRTNESIGMDYSAFLADLEAHLQYDPELDEIQFHVPSAYRRVHFDPALSGTNSIQDLQPEIAVVRTYSQWLASLAAMQTSRLMRESNIECVLRNGLITGSVRHRVQPVAAAQFLIVRTAGIMCPIHPTDTRAFVSDNYVLDAEASNQEGDDNSS
ncbi:uncharacterized protein N7479_008771 [Penicillium vulpinum]|uniref:Uncharacterized protein n=1 Tax=Penicillium vulpinum TaxID=29845 RepID=A0A1V6S1S6_9EURO|nr:uncharacterized protein N7479_008771 [Penicillium vulpinum]KAJ5950358.1 hypothetical protein N7479_008771 [Penicillium vulpinum]OQE07818.1 hypothetical protein PENVUL_c012G06036 [Penicillium vulpinum]